MIRLLLKLLKVLNSEDSPGQVAWAICFAAVMGLTPLASLHNILVLFLVLFLRVNISAFILFSVIFSGVAYLLDPLFHQFGYRLLTASALEGGWTALYNTDLGRLAGLNNTLVVGSLTCSLILWAPIYFMAIWGIEKYRATFLAWVNKVPLIGVLKASKFYRMYTEFS